MSLQLHCFSIIKIVNYLIVILALLLLLLLVVMLMVVVEYFLFLLLVVLAAVVIAAVPAAVLWCLVDLLVVSMWLFFAGSRGFGFCIKTIRTKSIEPRA